jgi:hypothetical protein
MFAAIVRRGRDVRPYAKNDFFIQLCSPDYYAIEVELRRGRRNTERLVEVRFGKTRGLYAPPAVSCTISKRLAPPDLQPIPLTSASPNRLAISIIIPTLDEEMKSGATPEIVKSRRSQLRRRSHCC